MLIVACKFIRLFDKVYDNNTLSSRLTRPSLFPLYPFPVLTGVVIWPGSYQDCQIKKTPFQVSLYKPKEIRLAKKSLLSVTEYGHLSASRNILMEILRISCFTV